MQIQLIQISAKFFAQPSKFSKKNRLKGLGGILIIALIMTLQHNVGSLVPYN